MVHLGRTAWGAESILHVDDDERGAGRVQPVEQMITATPLQHAIDNFLTHANGMHLSSPARGGAIRGRPGP
jgi:hypothetical protein